MPAEPKFLESFLIKCYDDILRGYTSVDLDAGRLFIKHFNYLDNYQIELQKEKYCKELELKNIKSEKEIKEQLFSNGSWTIKEEEELGGLEDFIDRMKESKKIYLRQSERDNADRLMAEEQVKIDVLKNKLNSFLLHSKERLLEKKITSFYIYQSFFCEKEFLTPYFDRDKIEEIDEGEFNKYIEIYFNSVGKISGDVLQQIAVEDFFAGPFSISKSVREFFDKPLYSLTNYQTQLFRWGIAFKNIFEQGEVDESIRKNPAEILLWLSSKRQMDKKVSEMPPNSRMVGVSLKDQKRLGVQPSTTPPKNMKF